MTLRAHRIGVWRMRAACALVVCAPAAASAQATRLPDHAPLNPVIASRSALASYAYRDAAPGWRAAFGLEYGSATELDHAAGALYVLDAELARATVAVTRDLDAAHFVLLEAGIFAAHAGVADALFDGFHRLIRYTQWSRANRPRNAFAYDIVLPSGDTVSRSRAPLSPGDIAVGIGRRHGTHVQSILLATLPLSTAPEGYRRGVPTLSQVNTVRLPVADRAAVELTLGAGAAPAHGSLAHVQRTSFVSSSAALRLRVWREYAVYGLLFYHSPVHDDVALPELDHGQLTIDFGAIFVAAGREWRIGLVEETRATDGGIDLVMRLGVSAAPRSAP